jgi:hypothetical protein
VRSTLVASALVLGSLASCGGDEPALTDATSLTCPAPGPLPFRIDIGFVRSANKTLAGKNPRSKDEASDTLGNPGGLAASIYLADGASPSAGPSAYRGAKARTTPTGGLFTRPLPGERVSLWSYDTAAAAWQEIGSAETDDDGAYEVAGAGFVAATGQPVYSMLEADGSCAEHYDYLLPPGSKVIVTDIDGTLTTDDGELLKQVADDTYTPLMMTAGDRLMKTWAMKGYPIIYLTARPHVYRNETRVWLRDLGFPTGPVITSASTDAAVYKTAWLQRMLASFGWTAVAVYGNADTDIIAYENAGVPKDRTFIVGPLAGSSGTVPIQDMDFTQHIATFVAAQPDNR